jgi:predicted transcriptional regulator
MTRLVNKGYLTRHRAPAAADARGVYTYAPRVPKADLLRTLVGDFVSRALGGSLSPFVAYLAQDARLTDADVADLRRLLNDLETRPPQSRHSKGSGK